jgi:membrane protease YdiL (CAAX protease family)
MNTKKIFLFLLFAFGISWLSSGILFLAGIKYGSTVSTIFTATLFMCAPAIAAIIVQKFFYKQPIKELGLKLREAKGLRFLWVPVFYLLLCLLWLGIVEIFGNAFQIKGFGTITFFPKDVLSNLNSYMSSTGTPPLTKMPAPPIALFVTQLISSFLLGVIVNTLFTLGEEFGWRGFLYNETKQIGFWKSNLMIGIIWGLWHAPLILQGHNYPEHPYIGVFMMVVFCIPLSFIMSYLRAKTNSVLAPALFHASINAIAGNLMMYTKGSDSLIGSPAGLSGALSCVLIVFLMILFDRKTIKETTV